MTQKMFITDFDGTLLRDDKTISPDDFESFLHLRKNKVVSVIATGRSLYSFEKAMAEIGLPGPAGRILPVDYLIYSTGAGVWDFKNKKTIRAVSIPSYRIPFITDTFDKARLDYMVHQAIPDTRRFLYRQYDPDNSDFNRRVAMYPEFAQILQLNFCHTDPATEVLAILPPERVKKRLIDHLVSALSDFSVIRATSPLDHKSAWLEVFHPNVSKSSTAAWLATQLGILPSDITSVGNDYNDQDLLEWSGRGVVVENAPEDLKKKFRRVGSNNHNGVSDAAALVM